MSGTGSSASATSPPSRSSAPCSTSSPRSAPATCCAGSSTGARSRQACGRNSSTRPRPAPSPLDPDLARNGLCDRDPALRAAALQIALPSNLGLGELTPLLQDRDPTVRDLAAVTLAEAGVEAARTPLLHSLRTRPTRRGLEALAAYQDAEALVRLGQLARARPALVALIPAPDRGVRGSVGWTDPRLHAPVAGAGGGRVLRRDLDCGKGPALGGCTPS